MIPNLNEKRRKRLRAEPRTTTGYRMKEFTRGVRLFGFVRTTEAVEDPPNECEEWNDFLRPYLN